MNTLGHRIVFTVLLILAVGALIVTSHAFIRDVDWTVRGVLIALTLLLWGVWTVSCRAMMRAQMREQGGDGPLSPPDAALMNFSVLQGVLAVVFVLSILIGGRITGGLASPWTWLGPAVPVAVLILWAAVFIRAVRAGDEMQQTVNMRAIAIAGGGVVFAASVWGMFETMAGAPDFPAFLLLPVFCGVYGLAMAAQAGRQR